MGILNDEDFKDVVPKHTKPKPSKLVLTSDDFKNAESPYLSDSPLNFNTGKIDASAVGLNEEQLATMNTPAGKQYVKEQGLSKRQYPDTKEIGSKTLDEPFMRFKTSLSEDPLNTRNYLAKSLPMYDWKLNNSNDVVYSSDKGKTWNLYQTTLPNEFTAKNIGSSITQKIPDVLEMGAMAGGAAVGIPGGLAGETAGSALGAAGANAMKQLAGNALGVTSIYNDPSGAVKQVGEHALMGGAGTLLGKTLLGPGLSAAKEGIKKGVGTAIENKAIRNSIYPKVFNPNAENLPSAVGTGFNSAKNAFGNAFEENMSGRKFTPTEQFPKTGGVAEWLGQGSSFDTNMRLSNEKLVKNTILNFDDDLLNSPLIDYTPEANPNSKWSFGNLKAKVETYFKDLLGKTEPVVTTPTQRGFISAPEGASTGELNPSVKRAIEVDKFNSTNHFNKLYNDLKIGSPGGPSTMSEEGGIYFFEATPGLDQIPFNRGQAFANLSNLDLKTDEGRSALKSALNKLRINTKSTKSDTLGSFLDEKQNIMTDLKSSVSDTPKIKSDLKLIRNAIEQEYQGQINNKELSEAYNLVQKHNAAYQKTLRKILNEMERDKDKSGLNTGPMIRNIKSLLDELEKTVSTDTDDMIPKISTAEGMPYTLDEYKRYLAASLKEKVMPTTDLKIDWNALKTYGGSQDKEYFKRLLKIGSDPFNPSVGDELAHKLEEISKIAKNPNAFPSQVPKQDWTDVMGDVVGPVAKLARFGAKSMVSPLRNNVIQPFYDPQGTAGRYASDILYQKLNKGKK